MFKLIFEIVQFFVATFSVPEGSKFALGGGSWICLIVWLIDNGFEPFRSRCTTPFDMPFVPLRLNFKS
jgi:hypothetical protein